MKVLVGLLVFVVGVAAAGIWYGNFYDGNLLGAMQSVEYMYKKNFAEISHDQKPTKSRNNSNNSSSSIIMQYRKILPLIRSIENNEGLHPGIENCELIYENHDVGSQMRLIPLSQVTPPAADRKVRMVWCHPGGSRWQSSDGADAA